MSKPAYLCCRRGILARILNSKERVANVSDKYGTNGKRRSDGKILGARRDLQNPRRQSYGDFAVRPACRPFVARMAQAGALI